MIRSRPMHVLLPSLLAGLLVGCGGGDAAKDDAAADPAAEATQSEAAPAEAAPPANPSNTPLAVEDIDRWAKGMEAERKAVQEAGVKLKDAKTGEDTLNAMMGVQEMTTVEPGAAAAGVDRERYLFVRTNLSAAASYLAPEIGGIDPSTLSPEMRAELQKGNEAQLAQIADAVPAEVVTALKPRATELRTKDLELVAARLRAAGAGK
jgi:hypothetical protein